MKNLYLENHIFKHSISDVKIKITKMIHIFKIYIKNRYYIYIYITGSYIKNIIYEHLVQCVHKS